MAGRRPVIPMPAGAAAADVQESDDSYLGDINLPGVAAADLDPELRDNKLRISGGVKDWESTLVQLIAGAGRSASWSICWRGPRRSSRTRSKRSCPTGTNRMAAQVFGG